MEYLSLGKIIDTFSLDGTIKVFSTSNNQDIRYKENNIILLCKDDITMPMKVVSYRHNNIFDFLKLEGINNIDDAKKFIGYEIKVEKKQSDLKKGYYFYSDLKGMSVYDENKKYYGKVIEVEEFPAQITLRVVSESGKQFFLPFIKEFIINVDLPSKSITAKILEGML